MYIGGSIGNFMSLSLYVLHSVVAYDNTYINTPPILTVSERNWRIPETESIGQVIARVGAEDAENDNLIFGLESQIKSSKLPFFIDSLRGVVYLNDTIVGRGGENFFLYVTVSDGHLTAKNEVFVNILEEENNTLKHSTVSNTFQNISQLFPSFDRLPGVQSIRNHMPHSYPPDFSSQHSLHSHNFTKIKPWKTSQKSGNKNKPDNITLMSTEYEISSGKLTHTVVVLIVSVFIFVPALVLGFVYFKRICRFRLQNCENAKEVNKVSDLTETRNTNVTENTINAMDMQQWNGPLAFSNRYVQWEGDLQQELVQTVLSPSIISSTATTMNVERPPDALNEISSEPLDTDKWEFTRHRLKFFNILGEGAFGQVWRCEAAELSNQTVTTVAVKTLKENASESEKKDLLLELEVMKSLKPHIHVVRLLGCCTEKDPIFVILEYISRGKLQTYLRDLRTERQYGNTIGISNILTSATLTNFMYQVAKGMDYLTSQGIIHRDLAARNILITEDHICKVADFGFARDVVTSKIYERKSDGKLPIRWMAIESLFDNIFSIQSDIWSFGVLMWEIVTLGSTPYPGIAASDVMRKVRDGMRLEKPAHCRRELYNIMYYCWAENPKDRPNFNELLYMLDKLLQTETEYIELESFPNHDYYNIVSVTDEKV